VQELFLTGRDNRTDVMRKKDFEGTLRQRRLQYQKRREAQGSQASKMIEKMRQEEGLGDGGTGDIVAGDAHPLAVRSFVRR
jgi:hypothetical protein